MNAESVRLAIGTLSKRTGCNIETIRYYERVRLLPTPARSAGGYRLYGTDHLKRLTFIRRARALGFSIDEVRTLLKLADERGDPPCGAGPDAGSFSRTYAVFRDHAVATSWRPTLSTASMNNDGRPHRELMKIAVTLTAIASIAQIGSTSPVAATGMPIPLNAKARKMFWTILR